jgi:hypothetical protein
MTRQPLDGGAFFVSGGAGEEERAQLTAIERDANLKIVFAQRQGPFVADIDVSIADARGHVVLKTASAGPWLIARLPPGKYSVKVSDGSRTQAKQTWLRERGVRTLHFYW